MTHEETDVAVIDPVAATSQEAEIHLGEDERNDDDGHFHGKNSD